MKRYLLIVTLLLVSVLTAVPAHARESRVKIIAESGLSMEIKEDGSLWEFGSVWRDETDDFEFVSPRLKLKDVKDAAVGYDHYLAVLPDGSLLGWGANNSGQLGNGKREDDGTYYAEPFRIMSNVRKCYALGDASMAITTDGSLWGWGELYDKGQDFDMGGKEHTKPKRLMSRVESVAIGAFHYVVLREDGTLWTWGINPFGELGIGNTLSSDSPKMIMTDVAMVAAGAAHSMALKKDGTLWAWGDNLYWQLGFDSADVSKHKERVVHYLSPHDYHTKPLQVMENVKFIAANDWSSMAIKEDGTLWAWGDNKYNQLGIGEVDYVIPEDYVENPAFPDKWYIRSLPRQIMSDVKYCSLGGSGARILKEDGSVWTTGGFSYSELDKGTDITVPRKLH